MGSYRLSHAAQADIVSILAWSDENFGQDARIRYETLIIAAIRDAASQADDAGHTPRPELGEGVFSGHLSQSRTQSPAQSVRRPRHFLSCRRDGDVLVIGRALHDAMDLQRHIDPEWSWE